MGPPQLSNAQQTFNRIFILGGKGASENEWRDTFEKFGIVSNVWITKDRNSGDDKGITYITYEKTSEACLAMEEMNGKYLPNYPRPLKVILASDKRDGSRRNLDEDKMLLRLFIMIPRGQSEDEVRDHFSQFGDLDYVRTIKDRRSGQSKGLAYVKFLRQYDGAKAFEECDSKYKPIFADIKPKEEDPRDYDHGFGGGRGIDNGEPRGSLGGYDRGNVYGLNSSRGADRGLERPSSAYRGRELDSMSASNFGPMDMIRNYNHWDECRLEALVPEVLSQEHVYKLFDLIPGLTSCGLDKPSGVTCIEYSTPQCAAYAKDKIHGMEYPPGYRLSVRFPLGSRQDQMGSLSGFDRAAGSISSSLSGLGTGMPMDVPGNLSSLVQSIQKATQVLQSAGINGPGFSGGGMDEENVRWCNVPLPTKKPFAPRDARVEERLFIVSQPESFPDNVLEDSLCRFGDLINAYFMPGKTFGYAKFGNKQAAQNAIDILHGQQVCGNRLKVMLADPPKYDRDEYDTSSKRPRNS